VNLFAHLRRVVIEGSSGVGKRVKRQDEGSKTDFKKFRVLGGLRDRERQHNIVELVEGRAKMTMDRYKITRVSACLSVCLSVCSVYVFEIHIVQFWSDLPQMWNIGRTCDIKDQVRWPIKSEVLNAHARQFTSGLANL